MIIFLKFCPISYYTLWKISSIASISFLFEKSPFTRIFFKENAITSKHSLQTGKKAWCYFACKFVVCNITYKIASEKSVSVLYFFNLVHYSHKMYIDELIWRFKYNTLFIVDYEKIPWIIIISVFKNNWFFYTSVLAYSFVDKCSQV